jgi:hypothetical protein
VCEDLCVEVLLLERDLPSEGTPEKYFDLVLLAPVDEIEENECQGETLQVDDVSGGEGEDDELKEQRVRSFLVLEKSTAPVFPLIA